MPADGDSTTTLALADLDEDGDHDLVLGNLGEPNKLYLNNGTGTFIDASSGLPVNADNTTAILSEDLDGDSDIDLFWGNAFEQNRSFTNLLRQVAGTWHASIGERHSLVISARPGVAPVGQSAVPFMNTILLASPLHIPILGTWRVQPAGSIMLAPVQIPSGAGTATLSINVPSNAALRGITVYTQLVFLHALSPNTWKFSSLHVERIW